MEKSLVSVIIPTYKRPPELIKRSVLSVINQTYKKLEIIVVDDSPNDYPKRKLVKEYLENISDIRVRYFQHSQNLGANEARNTGIKISKGEYCAFLDDDDEWLPSKIQLQMEKFDDDMVGLVYCKAEVIDEVNGTTRPILNTLKKGSQYHSLLRKNFIGSNSFVVLRKEALLEVGGYNKKLLSNQDYDLFLKIAKKYTIDYVDKVLVNYYEHLGERITTNPDKQLKGRLSLYEIYKEDIIKDKETDLIWKIKNIPLYFQSGYRKKAVLQVINLLFRHPIFFLNFLLGTIKYIIVKNKLKVQGK